MHPIIGNVFPPVGFFSNEAAEGLFAVEFMPVFTDEGMHASPMDDWSKEVERDALNEETARILGLAVPAIKSRLHRARLYLREQLARYLREGTPGLTVRQRAVRQK